MSPEYGSWGEVPHNIQRVIADYLGDAGVAELLNSNYTGKIAALIDQNTGSVRRIVRASELSEGQMADARKSVSPWHLIPTLRGNTFSVRNRDAIAVVVNGLGQRSGAGQGISRRRSWSSRSGQHGR